MVHSKSHEYHLGEGHDGLELCHLALTVTSKHTIPTTGGTGGYNAAYGGVSQGWFKYYEYPCHKKVSYLSSPEVMYNRYTHNPALSGKARRRYLHWLLSNDSPWKEFFPRRETHLPKGWKKSTEEYIYERGWVWTGFDWPSNLQHSFLVAQRMATEWPDLIACWNGLVESGCDPASAFLFLDVFKKTGKRFQTKSIYQVNYSVLYDWPLNIACMDETYARNFLIGKVTGLNPPFKDIQKYEPVNSIFGGDSAKPYPSLLFEMYNRDTGTDGRFGLTDEECQTFQKENALLGFSKYDYRYKWCLTDEDCRKIINLENRRLRCNISTDSNSKDSILKTTN